MTSEQGLVLGAVWRMPPAHVVPFARSLRDAGFSGRCALFVAHCDAPTIDALAELVDDVVVVDHGSSRLTRAAVRILRSLRDTRGLRRHYARAFGAVVGLAPRRQRALWWTRLEFHLHGLQSLRYAAYADYLSSVAPTCPAVLISDVRDVIFQGDPLADDVRGLNVFLEEAGNDLSRPGFNRRWGEDLYGARWSEIMHNRVSCSGVTMGDLPSMRRYVADMAAEIATAAIPMGPHDQAVHNWLLRRGALDPVTIWENGTAAVFTVDLHRAPSTDDGLVHNADGTLPAVVHRYDRHPVLAERLLNRHVTAR